MSRQKHDTPSPAHLAALSELTHLRWSIPLIAECHASPLGGWKYVTFLHRLGISRDSLGRTLAGLAEQGWVSGNPGIGHPLRPEYVLTAPGQRIAADCAALMRSLRARRRAGRPAEVEPAAARHPHGRPLPLLEIRALLAEATPRAISLALRELDDAGLIQRRVLDTYPPTTEYALTRRALRPAARARRLARTLGFRLKPTSKAPDTEQRKRSTA